MADNANSRLLVCPHHNQKVWKVEAQLDIGPAKIDMMWVVFECGCVAYQSTSGDFNAGMYMRSDVGSKVSDEYGFQRTTLNPIRNGKPIE